MRTVGVVLVLGVASLAWAQVGGRNTRGVSPVTITAVQGVRKPAAPVAHGEAVRKPVMYAGSEAAIQAAKRRAASLAGRKGVPVPDRNAGSLHKILGPVVGTSFEGIGDTGYEPPDPVIAAGPTDIVQAVNLSVRITDKSGALLYENTLGNWFAGLSPPSSLTDPKVVFDPIGQRFMLLVLGSDKTTKVSSYLIAVSQSSSAMSNWYLYKLDASANGTETSDTWADFPGLGFDSTAVYVTSNQYTFTTPNTFQYAKLRILDKSRMYAGLSLGWYDFWYFSNEDGSTVFSLKPAQSLSAPDAEFLLNTVPDGGSTLTVWSVMDPLSNDPIVTLEGTLDIGTYEVPPDAVQMGGANLINTTDCRTQDVVWRNDFLYTAFTEAYDWGSGTVSAIRVLKIDTQLGELDQDQIFGADGYFYYFPAASVNKAGVMHVVFNRSGSAEYVGVRAVTEVWNDAASTEVKQGAGYYAGTRWGDFSGISMDPAGTIWVAGEYATASSSAWGTWIASFGGSAAPTVTVTSPNGSESWVIGTVHPITWTSSGFTSARIEVTTDDGSTWSVVTAGTPASAGTYSWTVPATASTRCRVRVSDAADGSPSDQSNAVFTISANSSGGHFVKVWSGPPFVAMNFYVTAASVGGNALAAGDEIGIFDGSSCVGAAAATGPVSAASPLAMVASTDDPTTAAVDGFVPGHAIAFRIWKNGTEVTAVTPTYAPATPVPTFTSLGSCVVSLSGSAASTQTIILTAGWNIISLCVVPPNPNMTQILQPLIDAGSLVKVQDEQGNALEHLPGIGWINSIGSWAPTEGYYLRVASSSTLSVTGSPVGLPLTVPLSGGWNIIGYPRTVTVNALTAFQPLIVQNRLVKVQDDMGNAVENLPVVGWVNNIGELRAGEGYYLRASGASSLTFNPDGSTAKATVLTAAPAYRHFVPVFAGNPFDPMNVYVRLGSGTGLRAGAEIALYSGDRCVGATTLSEVHLQSGIVPLVAGMDDPSTMESDGFVPGSEIAMRVWDGNGVRLFSCIPEGSSLSAFAPRESAVLQLSEQGGIPSSALLLECYPNPFNPSTTIRYTVPGVEEGQSAAVSPQTGVTAVPSEVRLAVYDLLGREVMVLVHEPQLPGFHEVRFDGAGLASGVYACRLQSGERARMLKITLLR